MTGTRAVSATRTVTALATHILSNWPLTIPLDDADVAARFGEMSTLNNYLHQSTAMRAKKQLGPFYELVASITAEEVGHVELVAATINALLDQAPDSSDPNKAPFEDTDTPRINQHFIAGGPGHLVANSQGAPWSGDYVFNSGNLVMDLLHNFFLETGARSHKARVYENDLKRDC